jgi:hypothetical protein
MHSTLRSILFPLALPLVAFVACQPVASTTPVPAGGTAADPSSPTEPAEQPPVGEQPVSECGDGGTARAEATSCEYIVETSSGECCFAEKETACREAGCSTDACSLQKSNPPKAICTGAPAPSGGAATCEAAGGTCVAKTATVACKSTPSASCAGEQICCVM